MLVSTAACEPSAAAASSSSGPQQLQQPKPQRILACVLCQQRKVRCDRKFPCLNCVKSKSRCVPATLTQRRKRRFPERELLAQLRKYEDLLRRNNIKFEPLHKDLTPLTGKSSSIAHSDSDNEELSNEAVDDPLAKSEDVFETKSIWQAMLHDVEEHDDHEGDTGITVLEHTVKTALDQLTDDDHILFGSRNTAVDLSTLHPGPVDIFRLWQIYLDNVDPLFKAVHTPSLQPQIIEAARNINDIDPSLEALMFSIYCLAIHSLNPQGCRRMFGEPQVDLLVKFQFGCQQALINANYLRTRERNCLTALFFYLLTNRTGTDPRSLTAMLGLAIRIAQCMGIHSELLLSKQSVFEAEMRRRLWWSLMIFDYRISEKADYRSSSLSPIWDCKVPVNINNSDLRPDMKELPASKSAPTDCIFITTSNELADFVRHTPCHLIFANASMRPLAKDLPNGGSLSHIEKHLEEKYLSQCDPENRLHFLTLWVTRLRIAHSRLLEQYVRRSSMRSSASPSKHHGNLEERDATLRIAFHMLDCDSRLLRSPLSEGFRWFLQSYFPFPAYIHILQDLRLRPSSTMVSKAWEMMCKSFDVRFPKHLDGEEWDGEEMGKVNRANPLFVMFGSTVLGAWEVCEKAALRDGVRLEVPSIVEAFIGKIDSGIPNMPTPESEGGTRKVDQSISMFPEVDMGNGNDALSFGMTGNDSHQTFGLTEFTNLDEQGILAFGMDQFQWPNVSWDLE